MPDIDTHSDVFNSLQGCQFKVVPVKGVIEIQVRLDYCIDSSGNRLMNTNPGKGSNKGWIEGLPSSSPGDQFVSINLAESKERIVPLASSVFDPTGIFKCNLL